MWESIKQLIYRLFRREPKFDNIPGARRDVEQYQDTTQENMTAIIANALSVLAFADSSVSVTALDGREQNRRSAYLDEVAQRQWKNVKQNIAAGLGTGMIASIPYSVSRNGTRGIYVDTVMKDRFFITGLNGTDVTSCTVLADIRRVDEQTYLRWTDYQIENGVYIIRQKATRNGAEVPLESVEEWGGIAPEIRIGNVERLPIGIFRCPASNRRPKTMEGVPITYGCKATMDKIAACFLEIEKEYGNKSVKIFADRNLFDKGMKLTDLYVKLKGDAKLGSGGGIDVFDPAFRDTSLYNHLDRLFAQLEHEVGTSRGILTDLTTQGATATEIRRSMFQTFALCTDIQTEFAGYFDDLMYGVNVLCNFYGTTPPGEYKINYDWSYSLLEDSAETNRQLAEGLSRGVIRKAEYRQFLKPEETLGEAQAVIDEIKKQEPNLNDLIGGE